MSSDRWTEVEQLLQAALEQTVAQRSAFLARACGDDTDLREQVEALLDADRRAGGFLEASALEDAADLFGDGLSSPVAGSRIAHYVLEQPLGSGGAGDVYLARDMRLGRRIALKLLDDAIADDGESRARLLQEARMASAISHPHVCAVYEVGEADGHLFIAMQYVEGETLRRRIDRRPLAFGDLCGIALQVTEALGAAHALGIVHRDVKTCNIMVTPESKAMVLDFGLAHMGERGKADAQGRVAQPATVIGTPASMSPEQALGGVVDHRSDIFSVGVVLYEMATGRMPFGGDSPAEIVSGVLRTRPIPVADLNAVLPRRFSDVVDRALAKDPADRYQSIDELRSDLRAIADNETSPAAASRASARARAAALPLAVLLAVSMLVFSTWPAGQPAQIATAAPSGRSLAVLPFKSLVAAGRNEALEMGMADTLIASLSSIEGLDVRPISAVRHYGAPQQDALTAGREQAVDAVVEGGIQTSAERVRVTVRLLNVSDGRQLWAARFEEPLTSIFALQDTVAQRVSEALAVRLADAARPRHNKHVADVEAYQLYLLGRYHVVRLTDEGFSTALRYFEQAVARDPTFAQAHAGIAKAYVSLSSFNAVPPREGLPKARQAAETALRLDEGLADAHVALADAIFLHEWNWNAAEREYRRALALNPGDPHAHMAYGYYLAAMGRADEAIRETTRAVELDPLSLTVIAGLGDVLHVARRHEDAARQFRKALAMDPNFGYGHWALGRVLLEQRRYKPAAEALRRSIPLSGDSPDETAELARAYALAGKRTEALALLTRLTRLSTRRYVAPATFAALHAALGDKEQAFAWLARAREDRDFLLVLAAVEPMFDPLRGDARFVELLDAMHLPRQRL